MRVHWLFISKKKRKWNEIKITSHFSTLQWGCSSFIFDTEFETDEEREQVEQNSGRKNANEIGCGSL